MVSFASLFVGFVLGVINVKLMVSGAVDHVALLLDGRPVAELREPFHAPVDLGCEPAPHELVAIAFDARGKELSRARQWINRPRPTADASLVLDERREGRERVARLSWRALGREAPLSISVSFDGSEVPVTDPSRIVLPPYEPARIHFLRADLDFGKGVTAAATMVFGGSRTTEALAELTAIPVETEKERSLPPPEELAGWLERDGIPLEVAAIEEGPGEIVFVVDPSALERLRRMFKFGPDPLATDLPPDVSYRFLLPVCDTSAQSEMVSNVYPITRRLTRNEGVICFIRNKRTRLPSVDHMGQRIADAIVISSLAAAEGERRRAVVVLLGPDAMDGGLLAPADAISFLERVNVPLQVWSIGNRPSAEAARWPTAKSLTSARQFKDAVSALFESIARQRIVWVEGDFLPQAANVTPRARGLRIAR